MAKTTQEIFLEKVSKGEMTFVLLDEKYATQQTNTVLANGMELISKKEEIQNWYNEFANTNELLATVWNIVYHGKLEGVMFATLADTGDGTIDLDIAYPQYNNKVARIYNQGKSAVVYKKPVHADNGLIIKEYWDTEKVVRHAYRAGDRIVLDGIVDENGNEIKEVWKHNLGFLPVFVYKNKPKRVMSFGAESKHIYEQLSFDYPVRNLAMEYNISKGFSLLAEVLTIPRMAANLSASTLQEAKKKGGMLGVLLNQLYIKQGKTDTQGKLSNGVEILQGSLESTDRDEHLDKLEKDYAEGCGSSYQRDNANIQTATEVFYSNASEEKTANQDIKQIEDFMYKVIDAMLVAKRVVPEINPQDREYTFTVRGNKILADTDKVDMVIKKLQAGLVSLKEAIMEIYNCTEDEAEERVEALNKEAEEKQKAAMEIMSSFDSGESTIEPAENGNEKIATKNNEKIATKNKEEE